ncbi:MAG: 16S rRNA (guanine(527)-N(7))-methyltransferase RsmG [Bacteroidetes bacterium]|nr:16S rRNA (guanine(527)-N(7))-methyltransferase RsmG [Bacteroidota bacterium]
MTGVDLIFRYFPELTDTQKHQFGQLQNLYEHWNAQINVISRKDIDLLYERHVLHSLGIAKVIHFKSGTSILDVGTGGGFPGIPMAILFPECRFHLVDSIGKKIKVVTEVAAAIGLTNLTAEHERAEKLKDNYHFIISRAVTEFPEFYNWVRQKVSKDNFNDLHNGILYLKGGDLREEFGAYYDKATFYNLKDYFEGEFFETKKVVYYPL